MVQNLKVDVIYHMSPSDFEMEFNLSGRCRMRLLSSKTNDKKEFIKTLARNVARSRVIIACGPLFGDDGLISVVGTAIGNGVALCDNKTYGINDDQPIHIINGSTPLVTPDGYFGGCIIESGPQTLILLTENRAFRKVIMQNLIHPYVEEISYIPAKTSPIPTPAPEVEAEFETAVSDTEVYLTQPDDYAKELDEPTSEETLATPDEHNIEFIMDNEPVETQPDVDIDVDATEPSPIFENPFDKMYTEVETPQEIKSRYDEPYTTSESDNMFIAERQVDDEKPNNNNASRFIDITIVVLVLLLLLSVLMLVYFIVLKPFTMGVSTTDYLREIFGLASDITV